MSNEQLYQGLFSLVKKIMDNQHDIMVQLDTLIQGGSEHGLEVQAIHDKLVKEREENRKLEYENYLLKKRMI